MFSVFLKAQLCCMLLKVGAGTSTYHKSFNNNIQTKGGELVNIRNSKCERRVKIDFTVFGPNSCQAGVVLGNETAPVITTSLGLLRVSDGQRMMNRRALTITECFPQGIKTLKHDAGKEVGADSGV